MLRDSAPRPVDIRRGISEGVAYPSEVEGRGAAMRGRFTDCRLKPVAAGFEDDGY